MIFIQCNAKEFDSWDFWKNWISNSLMSIAFIWLEIIIYEVLLTLRESRLALSQLSTPISSLFSVMDIVNVTSNRPIEHADWYLFTFVLWTNFSQGIVLDYE